MVVSTGLDLVPDLHVCLSPAWCMITFNKHAKVNYFASGELGGIGSFMLL